MVELEKVIKSFEECLKTPRCQDCPWESCERADCARAEMPYDLVYAALEMLKAQESGWISVKERKPETKGQYLVATIEAGHYRHYGIVSFTDHFVMNGHRSYWKVTHWMPVPEMPKEET